MQEMLSIYRYLVGMTTQVSDKELEELFKFLNYKDNPLGGVIPITTSGRGSYKMIGDLHKQFVARGITEQKGFPIMSKMEPDKHATYAIIEAATNFMYRECGILVISDIPLEELFKPIQVSLQFIEPDMVDDKDNDEYLADFVLQMRTSPNLVMYDAGGLRFVP